MYVQYTYIIVQRVFSVYSVQAGIVINQHHNLIWIKQ